MTNVGTEQAVIFRTEAREFVAAPPDRVYDVVSDLTRSGEWSAECLGGQWVSGEPRTVGAVFRGENERAEDVVAWAPVVRGRWNTEAEVVAAEPGRTFRWAMRTKGGQRQDSVWGFDVLPAEGGSVLVHHFRMGAPTEGIREITADMDEAAVRRFYADWGEKLERDLATTTARIKAVIERG